MDFEPEENGAENLEDEFGQKVIKTRELTKLEKEYFEKARKKHKENMFRDQVVQGKTFKGQGFISKPADINFKDFTVGLAHNIQLQMTNVSFTFNSFKILPLKEQIRDFFDIIYTPPGRISAGMTCPVTIRFTPQLNEDINSVLSFQAETGPFEIPLICTSKKAIAICPIPIINFNQVIYGEDSSNVIQLKNQGALDTEVIIKSSMGNDIQTRTETSSVISSKQNQIEEDRSQLDRLLSQLKFQKIHILKGYSELNIPIQYVPKEIGPLNLPLQVYFENFLHSPPIMITLQGECIEVPIYVEKSIYDFQICLYNHVYRERIVFYNRGSNSMKIQIVTPKESKQFFEFNPKLGYIQGNSKFEIWVKFTANKELAKICANYIHQEVIEVPFKLVGADQKMPVNFTIKAKMTTSQMQILPGKVDFGKIYEGQASRQGFTIDNFSDLPQEFFIYPLPKEIEIVHDIIPIRVLPKQKFTTELIYRSTKQVGFDNDRTEDGYLKCKVITGTIATKEIRVPYVCEVMKCPLDFSVMKLEMPTLQIDESYLTTISIKNISQRDIMIEFFLPYYEISGLQMTPMVTNLVRESAFQFNFEYKSFFKKLGAYTLSDLRDKYENDINNNFQLRLKLKYEEEERLKNENEELKKEEELNKQGKSSKKQEKKEVKKEAKPQQLTKAQQQQLELEQQRQAELEKQKQIEEQLKREEMERNFDGTIELQRLGGKLIEFGEGPEDPDYSQHYYWLVPCYFKYVDQPDITKQVIFLEIDTVSVQKSLIISRNVIDFGEIAVGISQIKRLMITNNSLVEAEMKMDTLPISCGFTILNALRIIEPGDKRQLVVQFQPREEQYFEEQLKLYCKHTCVSAKLKGYGVRPEVKLEPEQGLMNMGGVVLGESVEKTFKITNVSNFAIKFELINKACGTQNLNGTEVFSFIPSQAIVNARESITIKLTFKPDRISDKFFELLTIEVPNQKDEKRIFVWGSCYNRQAYVNLHQVYNTLPQPQTLIRKVESPFDLLKIKDEDRIYSPSNSKILLEFARPKDNVEQQVEECTQRKIVVGSCKLLDSKLEKPCNFEINMPKDDKANFFVCDNVKGTVGSGIETTITFTFKPPQVDPFIANIEALQKLGQWKEVKAELKLSGGFIKANTNDLWVFDVMLRAFINQI